MCLLHTQSIYSAYNGIRVMVLCCHDLCLQEEKGSDEEEDEDDEKEKKPFSCSDTPIKDSSKESSR